MNDTENQEDKRSESAESRKPYEPPKLTRLGTIRELTQSLPGTSQTDNDPFTPGSTF